MTENQPSLPAALREIADLAAMTGGLVVPAALPLLCTSVVELAHRVFGAAACSLAVFDEESDELVYLTAAGAGAGAITGTRMPITRGLGGWVAQTGQAIIVSDLGEDRRFARDIAESTSYVPTALLAVPVESDGTLLGVLTVLDRDADRPGAERDLELATAFAAQAAAALQVRSAFADVGRVVLDTLRRAAPADGHLAAALAATPASPTPGPAAGELAGLLRELYRADPAVQQLAGQILREVLGFASAHVGRPRG